MLVASSTVLVVCGLLCVSVIQVHGGDGTIDATLANHHVNEDLNGTKNGATIERTQNVKINGNDVDTLDGFFNGIFRKVFKCFLMGSMGLGLEKKPGNRMAATNALTFALSHNAPCDAQSSCFSSKVEITPELEARTDHLSRASRPELLEALSELYPTATRSLAFYQQVTAILQSMSHINVQKVLYVLCLVPKILTVLVTLSTYTLTIIIQQLGRLALKTILKLVGILLHLAKLGIDKTKVILYKLKHLAHIPLHKLDHEFIKFLDSILQH